MNTKTASFTTAGNLYEFKSETNQSALRDQLNAKISQAKAMLNMIVSDGGLEHFNTMSDESQSDYLWSISMAVDECKDLIDRL